MANVLGPRSVLDHAIPPGVDAAEIMRFAMQDGMSPQEVIALAAATIGEANQYINQSWGGIYYITEMSYAMYRQGGKSGMTPKASEFALPDGVRTERIGHMLPLTDYDDATEWSRRYLERAHRESLMFDLEVIKEKWINRNDFDILWRIFTDSENQIGSNGWDVGWVIGANTQNAPYIPPQRGATVWDETVNNYFRYNAAMAAASAATALEEMAKRLSKLGHSGQKLALVSENDLQYYTAMDSTKFVRIIPGGINVVQGGNNPLLTVSGTLEGVPGEVFGFWLSDYGQVELRYHERIPAGRLFMSKSHGVNARGNGLALRVEAGRGYGMVVEPQISRSLNPALDKVLFYATHGVGVNDRSNGVVAQIAVGSALYENPAASDFGI